MRIYFILLAMIVIVSPTWSQVEINETADDRAKANITSSTGYIFKIIDGVISNDSIISVKRSFNNKGYRTETSVYKDGVLNLKYQFDYISDSIISARKTFKTLDNHLKQITGTVYEYNKKGELKKIHENFTNSKYSPVEKFKYNKYGERVRYTMKFGKRKTKDIRYEYGDNGKISNSINSVPAKEKLVYNYDENGSLSEVHKEFSDGSKKLVKYFDYKDNTKSTRHVLNSTEHILAIEGYLQLSSTDVLTTISTFNKHMQLKDEKEYLNGELNGYRKYYYEKYE